MASYACNHHHGWRTQAAWTYFARSLPAFLFLLFSIRPCLSIVLLSGETFKKAPDAANTTPKTSSSSQSMSASASTICHPSSSSTSSSYSSSHPTSICSSLSSPSARYSQPHYSPSSQNRTKILNRNLSR